MRSVVMGMAKLVAAAILLTACVPNLRDNAVLEPKPGGRLDFSDPLATSPTRPVQLPSSPASLPSPRPGGPNRAQLNPVGDAVAALGGDQDARSRRIPESDLAIVAVASRYGTNENIRLIVGAEDQEFRRGKRGRVFERWFNVNLYNQAYESMALDPDAELVRLRSANIRTPSAPPGPQ